MGFLPSVTVIDRVEASLELDGVLVEDHMVALD